MPPPGRFTVLVADFLEDASVESPVLNDIATLVLCGARDEEELAGYLPGADAIMLYHDIPRLGEVSFARASRCKCVVRAGVGYNNIDLEAAGRHGVVVCNVPDYGTEEVADHAIMFLLALARRLMPCHQAVRSGPGTTKRRSERPACGARRWAWWAAAGSARQPHCKPRLWDWTWCSMTHISARAWTRHSASSASTRLTNCSSKAISSACTATLTQQLIT